MRRAPLNYAERVGPCGDGYYSEQRRRGDQVGRVFSVHAHAFRYYEAVDCAGHRAEHDRDFEQAVVDREQEQRPPHYERIDGELYYYVEPCAADYVKDPAHARDVERAAEREQRDCGRRA